MGMNIIWTPTAQEGWQNVSEYILTNFGAFALSEFIERTEKAQDLISLFPGAGVPIYKGQKGEMARELLIYRRSRMLYHISGNTIFIDDFWDVRQHN